MPSGTGGAYHKLMGLENQERYNLGLTFGPSQRKIVPPDLDSSAIVGGDYNYRVLILAGLLQAGHHLIWQTRENILLSPTSHNTGLLAPTRFKNNFRSHR